MQQILFSSSVVFWKFSEINSMEKECKHILDSSHPYLTTTTTPITITVIMAAKRTKMPIPTGGAIPTMSTDILDVSVFVSGCSITAKMTFIIE